MGIFGRKASPTPSGAAASPAPPQRILIVEDDKTLATALELKFTSAGFAVTIAENGQVGLDMAIAQKPDLILLDLMMPVMDGKVMLRRLREMPEFATLPVIVLTNAGTVDNITETKTLYNASDFLIKSNVTPDDILVKVRQFV